MRYKQNESKGMFFAFLESIVIFTGVAMKDLFSCLTCFIRVQLILLLTFILPPSSYGAPSSPVLSGSLKITDSIPEVVLQWNLDPQTSSYKITRNKVVITTKAVTSSQRAKARKAASINSEPIFVTYSDKKVKFGKLYNYEVTALFPRPIRSKKSNIVKMIISEKMITPIPTSTVTPTFTSTPVRGAPQTPTRTPTQTVTSTPINITTPTRTPTRTPTPTSTSTGSVSGPSNGINLTSAPDLGTVTVKPNRDSVVIDVPWVAGVKDYRVLVLDANSSIQPGTGGTEIVTGAKIYCAGLEQHAARLAYTIYTETKRIVNPFYIEQNLENKSIEVKTNVVQKIEVTGITGPTQVYVEAVDRLCPFPGVYSQQSKNMFPSIVSEINSGTARGQTPIKPAGSIFTYPLVSEAEVLSRYGNLIYNGHGHDVGSYAGMPATFTPPKVLARKIITVAPSNASAATADFFDDFSNSSDTFVFKKNLTSDRAAYPQLMQNSKWNFYSYGWEHQEVYPKNGELHTLLADWAQDVFAQNTLVPKKPAHLSQSGKYLHVTFEVNANGSDRRYWLFYMCGPTPGIHAEASSFQSDGSLSKEINFVPFFHASTGVNPSLGGWNCLHVFPRDGFSAPGGSYAYYTDDEPYLKRPVLDPDNPSLVQYYKVHPETEIRVMLNKPSPGAEPLGGNYNGGNSVVNVSPKWNFKNSTAEPSWYYQRDSQGKAKEYIYDDQQQIGLKAKIDLYIKNDQIVMYVDGSQRLCNGFNTPATKLNMKDVALGFSQILYHSAAEREGRADDYSNDPNTSTQIPGGRAGQIYYNQNSPFIDSLRWDNMGFEEEVSSPPNFNAAECYNYQ